MNDTFIVKSVYGAIPEIVETFPDEMMIVCTEFNNGIYSYEILAKDKEKAKSFFRDYINVIKLLNSMLKLEV